MDGRPTWTDCDEAGDYVVPNVLSPRDLVSRPDIMDETVPHTSTHLIDGRSYAQTDAQTDAQMHGHGQRLMPFRILRMAGA